MENQNYKNFREKFRIEELTVLETEHWTWSVRPMQPTIGCGILSMKRPAEAVSEMTEEEGADMTRMIRVVEKTLQEAFGYQRIHYILYMLEDFHVHYHIIPRYDKKKIFEGQASMFQDFLHDRKMEIDAITGYIVEKARKHDIPVPVNETICRILHALEGTYSFEYRIK